MSEFRPDAKSRVASCSAAPPARPRRCRCCTSWCRTRPSTTSSRSAQEQARGPRRHARPAMARDTPARRTAARSARVDPARQRLRPARDRCATSTPAVVTREGGRTVREFEIVAEDKEIEVAPGVKFAAWAYNGRVPGPTLRATEGDRVRIKFVNASEPPAHDALPRHPRRADGRRAAGGARATSSRASRFTYEFEAEPFGLHLYHCHSTPLADHIAKGLYGAFIIDPKERAPEGRRAGDGDERLRHQLRPRERGLRGQHGRLRLPRQADPGEARRAGADLPREHPRVRPPQLVPRPRQLLRLLPDRHASSSRATSPTR